jgi:hypothetical protein
MSPGAIRLAISIVNIGAGFAYRHGERPKKQSEGRRKINEIKKSDSLEAPQGQEARGTKTAEGHFNHKTH